MSLTRILREVRACRLCSANLPFGSRPVLQLSSTARLLIVGQAPGSKVHESGIPWNDASGDRLRDWLTLDRSVFYDVARVAIVPMGFRRKRRRQSASAGMCTALAPAPAEASSGYPVDAFGRSIRPATLFGINAKRLDDGDRPGIFGVRATILPVTASKLAQCSLDAKASVVRGGGNSPAPESRAKVDLIAIDRGWNDLVHVPWHEERLCADRCCLQDWRLASWEREKELQFFWSAVESIRSITQDMPERLGLSSFRVYRRPTWTVYAGGED